MDLDEKRRLLRNYRGRRLLLCRAIEDIHDIIESIGIEDGSQLPMPDSKLPDPPSMMHKREMQNTAANLLRTVLLWNDGHISHQELRRY